MKEKYIPQEIEKKWQKIWSETDAFRTELDSDKKKYYVLEMFPYPSGNLHMGHVRNYSIGDVVARFNTMNGWDMMHSECLLKMQLYKTVLHLQNGHIPILKT